MIIGPSLMSEPLQASASLAAAYPIEMSVMMRTRFMDCFTTRGILIIRVVAGGM